MIPQSRTGIRNVYAVRENGYRFTFNGMEKDDEVKGVGNSLDFGARIYDSRLGRWLSVDPLSYKFPICITLHLC
jgi:RHS repeat-associated protein